jgi:hypothetical protein
MAETELLRVCSTLLKTTRTRVGSLLLVIQGPLSFQPRRAQPETSHFSKLAGAVVEEHLPKPSRVSGQSGPSSAENHTLAACMT